MISNQALILAVVAAAQLTGPAAGAQSIPDLLEKAIFTEETLGDLDAAMEMYQSIAARAAQNQPCAARAQFRMGICLLKQGLEQKAVVALRRLIREFPAQRELTAQAKAQLAALGQPYSEAVIRQAWAPALDLMGEPSPDGRYISYVNWATGNLAIHDLSTGENRDLSRDGTWDKPQRFCDASIWSPDSRQVAYYWLDRGQGNDLRVAGIDGSPPRVLYSSGAVDEFAPWPRAWSRDGKYILAFLGVKNERLPMGYEGQFVLVSTEDGSVRVLRSGGRGYSEAADLSPDGRYVVFEFEEERGFGEWDIRLLATDGSGEVPLIVHPAEDRRPCWTPDGERIVFVSDRSGSPGLWSLAVHDGMPQGEPTLIREISSRFAPMAFTADAALYFAASVPTLDIHVAALDFAAGEIMAPSNKVSLRFEGSNYASAWSPDGQHLAYASRRNLQRHYVLVIRSMETGEEQDFSPDSPRLVATPDHYGPQWSPDGRSLLVAGEAEETFGLYLLDVATGELAPVARYGSRAEESTSVPQWPLFSADGTELYYVRDQSILVLDLDTKRERILYTSSGYLTGLARSPDGQRLAYWEATHAAQPEVLNVIPVSGGEPHELLRLEEEQHFPQGVGIAWTPDGRHVIVGRPRIPNEHDELWRIPLAGGEPTKLNLGVRVRHLTLHPDGDRISFTSGEDRGEVWVMENILPTLTAAR